MRRIAVLMCTYNGEKYLREQIDSILSQRNVSVSLFVRDDGSLDKTLDILNEYMKKGALKWYQGNHVGPAAGFMELLYRTPYEDFDYCSFSDQDDIWLEDKLKNAVEIIEKCIDDEYVLYGSNQTLYKEGRPMDNVYKTPPILNTPYLLNHNKIAGCTIVVNKNLVSLVCNSSHIDTTILKTRMHDLWLVMIACVCGKIVFDMRPSMLYRNHDSNVVGKADTSLKTRIKRIRTDRGERSNSRSKYAGELIRCFENVIRLEDMQTLALYANYRSSFRKKIMFLKAVEIINKTGESRNIFRLKILCNYI